MLLTDIDHVAIAVHDLEGAIAFYEAAFGAEVHHRETVESDGVEEALLKVGTSYIQLTRGTTPDSPISKFLEKRGPGVHHLSFQVEDLDAVCERVAKAGYKLIYDAPRPGAHSMRINFVHPASTGGILVELMEPADS